MKTLFFNILPDWSHDLGNEDLYYEELMTRVATSKKKENVTATYADTSGTYGGAKK